MMVRVRLFAGSKDIAGSDAIDVEVSASGTVADLRRAIGAKAPKLAALLPRCAVAVNEEFAGDSTLLPPNAQIAIIPPVSGG